MYRDLINVVETARQKGERSGMEMGMEIGLEKGRAEGIHLACGRDTSRPYLLHCHSWLADAIHRVPTLTTAD